jgi:hypothetical protein
LAFSLLYALAYYTLFMLATFSLLDATSGLDASQRSFGLGLGLGLDLVCLPCPSSLYAHKKKRRRLREHPLLNNLNTLP